jgi:hypothetical protein
MGTIIWHGKYMVLISKVGRMIYHIPKFFDIIELRMSENNNFVEGLAMNTENFVASTINSAS